MSSETERHLDAVAGKIELILSIMESHPDELELLRIWASVLKNATASNRLRVIEYSATPALSATASEHLPLSSLCTALLQLPTAAQRC